MEEREFRQGDGLVNLLPDEAAVLRFTCRDCGSGSSVTIVNGSQPKAIDCNEERQCLACEKTTLVRMHRERGSSVSDDDLLKMTRDELLALGGDGR